MSSPKAMERPGSDGGHCFDQAASAQMEQLVVDLGRVYRERNEALDEVARAHHEALIRLALAADFRDDDTGVHIVRIGFLAEHLARKLGLPASQAAMLRRAAPMHDLGKIGIADRILKKPGPLDADERREMNRHAQIGADILGRSRIPLFQMAAEIALAHHERFDGTGYPSGLRGQQIPLTGRIVAVVDFFDAMTMDRVYRPAFSDQEALRELAEQRGRAFDPQIADTFLAHAAEFAALRQEINLHPPSFDCLLAGPVEADVERGGVPRERLS